MLPSHINLEFIRQRTDLVGDCWEWRGAKSRANAGRLYGSMSVTINGTLRTLRAHRVAYEVVHGPLGSLHCLHKCDNTICCNPEHLFAGTHADNMSDMKQKGRSVGHPGDANPNARLSAQDVESIRSVPRKSLGGMTNRDLADQYGVNPETIARLRRGIKGAFAQEAAIGAR